MATSIPCKAPCHWSSFFAQAQNFGRSQLWQAAIVENLVMRDNRMSSGLRCTAAADMDREDDTSLAPSSQFIKKLDEFYPKAACLICRGLRQVVCDKCGGSGRLAKGGYHKSNPVAIDRIIGSKWTAMERTFGWRHFTVASKRRARGTGWFLEMVATCDQSARFWVNARNLKDRERWSMGWLQKREMLPEEAAEEEEEQKKSASVLWCKSCKGMCQVACMACSSPDSLHLNKIIHV